MQGSCRNAFVVYNMCGEGTAAWTLKGAGRLGFVLDKGWSAERSASQSVRTWSPVTDDGVWWPGCRKDEAMQSARRLSRSRLVRGRSVKGLSGAGCSEAGVAEQAGICVYGHGSGMPGSGNTLTGGDR